MQIVRRAAHRRALSMKALNALKEIRGILSSGVLQQTREDGRPTRQSEAAERRLERLLADIERKVNAFMHDA